MNSLVLHLADVVIYGLLLMSLTAGAALIVLAAWVTGRKVISPLVRAALRYHLELRR